MNARRPPKSSSAPSSPPLAPADVSSVKTLFAANGLAALIPLAVIAWDKDLRIIGWNPTAESLFGWKQGEVVGKSVLNLLPEAMRAPMQAIADELFQQTASVHRVNENLTKDGRLILCEWHNTLLKDAEGRLIAALSMAYDVTERQRTAYERESLLERQRRFMEIATAINASRKLDEILLQVRDAVIEVGGFDRAGVFRVEGESVRGAWGTDTQGGLLAEHDFTEPLIEWGAYIPDFAAGRRKFVIVEEDRTGEVLPGPTPSAILALRTGGELVGLLCVDNLLSGRPVEAENLQPLLPFCEQAAVAIANARLLAERARQQERLRRLTFLASAICASADLNEILRMVRDAIVDAGGFDRAGVFLFDREHSELRGAWGTDREGNPSDISFYCIRVAPGMSEPIARVALGDLDYYLTSDLSRELALPDDHAMYGVKAHSIVPLRVNGSVVGVVAVDNLLRAAPISEADIRNLLPFTDLAAVAIQNARLFQDLSSVQEALIRSEKLRAVGELASGVAHNVNNVLAAVLGYAELIQSTEEVSAEIKSHARTIERAALDGADIVRRMQRFAHMETEQSKAPFDLAVITQEAIDLTRPVWHNQAVGRGAHIVLVVELTQELWVLGVASEVREVIVNLIKNAAEAMPEGGTLTVRVYAQDGQMTVEVRDTGIGMDETTRQRVFEPFFTTKGARLGMGMGLSVAWGIMNQHQGRIVVESAPGEGTVFRISLPSTSTLPTPTEGTKNLVMLSGVRILLTDDEDFVLEGLARALVARGANVALAGDAAEAQVWLNAHAAECDLILSDHGMVGMTGLELLTLIRERYPHIRRVLLSGWGANLPDEMDMSAAELILAKPIRHDHLATELAALLASPL